LFFTSAIAVGLAMTIFESWHSSKAFGRHLETPLLQSLASVLAVVQSTYVAMRFMDMTHRKAWGSLLQARPETYLFILELSLIALPLLFLYQERVRKNPRALYWSAMMVIFGFITNRLNVSVTGIERASGVTYFPKWTEIAVTLFIIAVGFGLFRLAVQHLPIFEEPEEEEEKPRELGGHRSGLRVA
jgi:Ni/Fe-hydrogenase subunit HybB-like protein